MRLPSVFLVSAALLSAGCGSYSVYRVARLRPAGQERLEFPAVFYALPRTVLTVEAKITRSTTSAAECAPFRDIARDLGLDESQLALAPRSEFRQHGLRIQERAEPDPDQIFAVRVDDDALRSRTQDISLSREGFLTQASVDTTSKIEDYVVQTLEIAADITGRALKLFGAADGAGRERDALRKRCVAYKQEMQQLQDRRRDLLLKSTTPLPADTMRLLLAQLDQRKNEILTHFTGTRTLETGTIRCEHTPAARYDDSGAARPGFTARQQRPLYAFSPAVGLSRIDGACTVTEELAPDGAAYAGAWQRVIAARLGAQVRADKDRGRAELLRRCDEDLARAGGGDGVLGRVGAAWGRELARRLEPQIAAGQLDGLVTGLSGAVHALAIPALPELQPAAASAAPRPAGEAAPTTTTTSTDRCDAAALRAMLEGLDRGGLHLELARATEGSPVSLFLDVEEPEGQLPAVVARWQRAPRGEAGFFYRVPGSALVSVGSDARQPLLRTRRPIPQLGVVTALAGPGDVRSLAARYELALFPTLGALQTFGAKTQALRLGDAAAAASKVGGAALDWAGQRADPAKELDDLVRQRMLLEEKQKIRDLQSNPSVP